MRYFRNRNRADNIVMVMITIRISRSFVTLNTSIFAFPRKRKYSLNKGCLDNILNSGGESGIRTRENPYRLYTLSRRACSATPASLRCGEGGIRTHGPREETPLFENDALNRSATSPDSIIP